MLSTKPLHRNCGLTMLERATLFFGTTRVTSNVALTAGSSQQGKALRASVAYKMQNQIAQPNIIFNFSGQMFGLILKLQVLNLKQSFRLIDTFWPCTFMYKYKPLWILNLANFKNFSNICCFKPLKIFETFIQRKHINKWIWTSNCVTAPYFSSPEGEEYLLL